MKDVIHTHSLNDFSAFSTIGYGKFVPYVLLRHGSSAFFNALGFLSGWIYNRIISGYYGQTIQLFTILVGCLHSTLNKIILRRSMTRQANSKQARANISVVFVWLGWL